MKCKNILDEMQDQKRLQIESRGLWIAYFGLALAIMVQTALGDTSGTRSNMMGEAILMVVLALYLLPNYFRYGIWSVSCKPTYRTNLLISGAVALVVALYWGIVSYMRYGKLLGSIATGVFMFVGVLLLTLLLLSFSLMIFKQRMETLEKVTEETEDDVPQG